MYCLVKGLQLLYADVAVLDTLAVTAQADVALLVEQTGVVELIYGVGVLVATVGSHVVTLSCGADITIDDNLTINRYGDAVALHADLLLVPLAQRAPLDALCGDDTIYRAVYLILAQVLVDG